MSYANIISDFTWSYSRITSFEMCPYKFLLRYIKDTPSKHLFFSDFGSFIHKIIEMRLNGYLDDVSTTQYYIDGFRNNVIGKPPNNDILKSYFGQGLEYLDKFDFPYAKPKYVEYKTEFDIDGVPFVGIIDCVADNDGLVILDNKSRTLKPRSKRKKPTQSDAELDSYLRQLYIYSLPIKREFGEYPDRLEFNCFRSKQFISERFDKDALDKTTDWALRTIDKITHNENWNPNIEYFKCRYLCDVQDSCCYFQMNKGR